jgi:predicted ATPase
VFTTRPDAATKELNTMPFAENAKRFFVVTGGPGSGKSTLLDALFQAGCSRSIEAGRAIIQDQVAIGGGALPWSDPSAFAELMLSWEMRSYHIAETQTGPVFFDRGVIDVLGYLRLVGRSTPAHMQRAAETFRYNRHVFIAPPWQEIFATDWERKQDFEEAVRTYDALRATYTAYNYELIEIPRVTIPERVRFLLTQVRTFAIAA